MPYEFKLIRRIEFAETDMAGIVHFVWGRYCNYRAVQAIGSNLAGPFDEHLRQIELKLGVEIANRGNVFRVSGPADSAAALA